ncbi:hypothetical protein [Streptomyces sp. NPDC052225]|uniref:hypothetical protein n=1 Tax=Streptomyces sp. NPDC052225 TaxID=3154949 RepID=UPI00341EB3F8
MVTSEDPSHEIVRKLAAGVAPSLALDAPDPASWIGLDHEMREPSWQYRELFHAYGARSGRRRHRSPDASAPAVTWTHEPDDVEPSLALRAAGVHTRIRSAPLSAARHPSPAGLNRLSIL